MAKSGTSKAAAATRRRLFIETYLANGHNATQAAISAGYSAKTAGSQGQRLLKDVNNFRSTCSSGREGRTGRRT
jgi:phage terminase small subunit